LLYSWKLVEVGWRIVLAVIVEVDDFALWKGVVLQCPYDLCGVEEVAVEAHHNSIAIA